LVRKCCKQLSIYNNIFHFLAARPFLHPFFRPSCFSAPELGEICAPLKTTASVSSLHKIFYTWFREECMHSWYKFASRTQSVEKVQLPYTVVRLTFVSWPCNQRDNIVMGDALGKQGGVFAIEMYLLKTNKKHKSATKKVKKG
jgi:hypothetical protein